MEGQLLHATPTVVDLLALMICLGTLSCRLWVLPGSAAASPPLDGDALLASLWRLLLLGFLALMLSSVGELGERAMQMSGRPLAALLPVLPTVLWRTHYGQLWLVRPAALLAFGIGWWLGKRRLQSPRIPAVLWGVAALVAATRSASGHAADWGDLTLAELSDWLHLLAASCWGGGLLALAVVVLPATGRLPDHRRRLAVIARRFSTLAGAALAGVLATGIYNAWLQVGSVGALWRTSYGRTLLVKLLLVVLVLALGAANRYLSVPLLQRWAGLPVAQRRRLHGLLVLRSLVTGRRTPQGARLIQQFTHKVWAEALGIVGVLLCTALLVHGVPARHAVPAGHMHAESATAPPHESSGLPRRHGGCLAPKGWRPVLGDQLLQDVQLAGDGCQGILIDEDRQGGKGLPDRLQADMDLRISGHRPFAPCVPKGTCQAIGVLACSWRPPVDSSSCNNLGFY
jgi:putative copper export protein